MSSLEQIDSGKTAIRIVKILTLFGQHSSLKITEIAALTDLPKTTVHRLVHTLSELGMLEFESLGRRYHLGPSAVELGRAALRWHGEALLAYPELWRLAQDTGEGVNLGVPVPTGVLYVQKVRSAEPLQVDLPVGTIVPFHCTAIGKAFLAFSGPDINTLELVGYTPTTIRDLQQLQIELDHIIKKGVAVDNEEFLPGVRCIGAPIRNSRGIAVAGIAIAAPTSRMDYKRLEQLAPVLLESATRVSRLMP